MNARRRRRQLVLRALFEIRGAFPENTGELLDMTDSELLELYVTIEKAVQSAQETLPPGQI
jgi:hypothetical protein